MRLSVVCKTETAHTHTHTNDKIKACFSFLRKSTHFFFTHYQQIDLHLSTLYLPYPTSGILLRREVRETLGRFACDGGTGRPAAAAAAAAAAANGRAVVLAFVVVLAVIAVAAAAAASPAT